MKYKHFIFPFLIIATLVSTYYYTKANRSLKEIHPDNADHILLVKVLEKNILDTTTSPNTKDQNPANNYIKFLADFPIKGSIRAKQEITLKVGNEPTSLKVKKVEEINRTEKKQTLNWMLQQDTLSGFEFEVNQTYILFLNNSKDKDYKYELCEGLNNTGWVVYIPREKKNYVIFKQSGLERVKDQVDLNSFISNLDQ